MSISSSSSIPSSIPPHFDSEREETISHSDSDPQPSQEMLQEETTKTQKEEKSAKKSPSLPQQIDLTLSDADQKKTTLQLIIDVADNHGFNPTQIKNVKVSGVKAKETQQIHDGYGDTREENSSINMVDSYKHNEKVYAKLLLHYEVTVTDGQKTITLKFDQPQFTNVEIPLYGTPRQETQFEKKMQALVIGIRDKITSTIGSKNVETIKAAAQKRHHEFEFVYGKDGYVDGRKREWRRGQTIERRDVIGVYHKTDTVFQYVTNSIRNGPFLIDNIVRQELFNESPVGSIRCTALQQQKENRKNLEKICLTSYREQSSRLPNNELENPALDKEQLISQQARSSYDLILDIDQFLSSTISIERNLQDGSTATILLHSDTAQRIEKLIDLRKRIDEDTTKLQAKRASDEIKNEFTLLENEFASSEEPSQQDRNFDISILDYEKNKIQFFEKLRQIHHTLAAELTAIQPLTNPIIGRPLSYISGVNREEQVTRKKELEEKLHAVKTIQNFIREENRIKGMQENSKNGANIIYQRFEKLQHDYEDLNRRQATVAVMYGSNNIAITNDKIHGEIEALHTIRKQLDYNAFNEKIAALKQVLTHHAIHKEKTPSNGRGSNNNTIQREYVEEDIDTLSCVEIPKRRSIE